MTALAVIPAAGRGSRLDRRDNPKPLVEVGGQALLVRNILGLRSAGVTRVVVLLGHRAEEIERVLRVHPALAGVDLEIVHSQDHHRGLAGSLLAARPHVHGDFVLAMADHVFDPSLVRAICHADRGDADLVMTLDQAHEDVVELASAVKCQVQGTRVRAVARNLGGPPDAVDCGLFLASPALFDALESQLTSGHPEAELFDAANELAARGRVSAIFTRGAPWFDVDTPVSAVRAEMALRTQQRTRIHRRIAPDIPPDTYEFQTGAPASTQIFVQRGLHRSPHALPLIPSDAASSPHFVVTDPRVQALYGETFVGALQSAGYDIRTVVVPEGEAAKTLEVYGRCVDEVLSAGIDEGSVLISLGGGVVCNVSGFLASTLYRGIGLVHVPTTLMAQCDAAISHKQAVNGGMGKNLVGSYYAPLSIAVDPDVLATLEDWRIADGLAEVLKHALGQDVAYIEYLRGHGGSARDPGFLEEVVRRNVRLKCELMRVDPREKHEGMVLQYGHTVGHPIEFLSGFSLSHGQAVAIGMVIAARVSRMLGAVGEDVVQLHRDLARQYGLPTEIPRHIQVDDIMDMLRYNKRYLAEGTRMALLRAPGELWSVDGEYAIPVPEAVLRRAIAETYG